MNFLTSMDDFPELSRGEGTGSSNGLAVDPPSEDPRTLEVMPSLTSSETAEPTVVVEVTAVDEPDAPAPETVPVPLGPVISNDDLPEPIIVPSERA